MFSGTANIPVSAFPFFMGSRKSEWSASGDILLFHERIPGVSGTIDVYRRS